MKIAIPLFERVTALDAIGPYEVLDSLPGWDVTFVGEEKGPVRTESGTLGLIVDRTFDELPDPQVIVVPGGFGTRAHLDGGPLLDWVKAAHETSDWTTSVCTGSLVLGAAGILDGLEATSHWMELETLKSYGATPTKRRVVEQGKVITAAGVSSGIDMALTLVARIAGDEVAKAVQLGIEYDPQPPFDSGSTEKASAETVDLVRAAMTAANEAQ
jgi:transcriptional regulator GlxA family with amidase domain